MPTTRTRDSDSVPESPQSNLAVRKLEERDLSALLLLTRSVAAELLWLGTEPGFDEQRYLDGWRKMIAEENGAAFAATLDGELAGSLHIVPRDGRWELGMFVDARHRGKGAGTALLEAAFRWARERLITELYLYVFPHNMPARALYEKAGFAEIERFENDVTRKTGEVWDTILMRKRL